MPRFLLFLLFLLLLLVFTSAHSGHEPSTATEETQNIRSKHLVLVKIWCLILIFVATFLSGISPCFLKWNEGFLVLGTQFAGGVFLGTAIMHFLSDANETFSDLTEKEYPFSFMLACAGYLITVFADCLISYLHAKSNNGGGAGDVELQQGTDVGKTSHASITSLSKFQGHNENHHSNPALTAASSLGDTILLIIALCFHSVFEGIAIGVAETEPDAWKALWTISLHKIFAAMAMGIALLRVIPNRPLFSCAAYAFAFAISSPIGVAIGIIIDATTQGAVADWIFAISMSLACGVFIYVSINHLLSKGYTPQKEVVVDKPFQKFLAVLLGVGAIAVVMIWDT